MSNQPPFQFGNQQPQQPMPQWGAPMPPAPKKKMGTGKKILIGGGGLLALLIVVGVAGSGGSSDGDKVTTTPVAAGSHDDQPSSAPAKKPAAEKKADDSTKKTTSGKHDPKDDVKVTSCKVDQYLHWPSAELKITNHSSDDSNYMIQMEFLDSHGVRISEGFAATNNLSHGKTAIETAQGTADSDAGTITCHITDVQRYASN